LGQRGRFVQAAEEATIDSLRLRGELGLVGSSFDACAHTNDFKIAAAIVTQKK
jgi:hypothetical protein